MSTLSPTPPHPSPRLTTHPPGSILRPKFKKCDIHSPCWSRTSSDPTRIPCSHPHPPARAIPFQSRLTVPTPRWTPHRSISTPIHQNWKLRPTLDCMPAQLRVQYTSSNRRFQFQRIAVDSLTDPRPQASPVQSSEESLTFLENLSLVDDHEDRDLLQQLPEYHIVDQALRFFTDQCCVMSASVSAIPETLDHMKLDPYILKSTLLTNWDNFKSGVERTRITLSLVFVCVSDQPTYSLWIDSNKGCIAIALQFLPLTHDLLLYLRRENTASVADLSDWYYERCCMSLVRHENDTTMPSLELVEAQLIKMFYLGISKSQAEEIWRLRGCTTSNVRRRSPLCTEEINCTVLGPRSRIAP